MSQRPTPILVSRTDVGLERQENQDAFGSATHGALFFAFVCDGMGGYQGGSTAANLAVETLTEQLSAGDDGVEERLRRSIVAANRAIYDLSRSRRDLAKMGTTAVVLAVDPDNGVARIAHVGDSRIYLIRDGVIRRITRDHTMVQALVDDCIIDAEQARNHPNSNIITRSLGGRDVVEPEVAEEVLDLRAGDLYVLCSDGLHGQVEEDVIATVATTMPLEEAADELIKLACESGGPDNITVQLVQIDGAPSTAEAWAVEHPPILRPRKPRVDSPVEDTAELPAIAPAAAVAAPMAAPNDDDNEDDGFVFVLVGIAVAFTLGLLLIVFAGGFHQPSVGVDHGEQEGSGGNDAPPPSS